MKLGIAGILQYLGVGLIAFFSPIKYAFILTGILVLIDTITGTMKAYHKKGAKGVKSNKAFRLVPKSIFFALFIIAFHALEVYVDPTIPFVKLCLIGIAWIEVKSVDENFEAMYGYSFINKIMDGMAKLKDVKKRADEDEIE